MSSAIVSYHLPKLIIDFINKQAKKCNLPKGKFLLYLIEDYQKTKQENKNLKTYFEMAKNKEFFYEQIQETEEDLQVELAINPDL